MTENTDSQHRTENQDADAGEDRKSFSHVATMRFTDFDHDMAALYGPRYTQYRETFHKSLNYDKNGFVPDFPVTLMIELVNRCNLSCIMCYTQNHDGPKSVLPMDTIEAMLQEGQKHGLPALVIGGGSEGLLYKPMQDVIESAVENGVMDIFFASNGVLMTEKVADYLIENKVSRCWISLDAATPETFKTIRGKDELDLIEKNIRRLCEMKKERGAVFPNVRVSFCVQQQNVHERELFVEKWQGIVDHIDFQQLTNFDQIDELFEKGDVENPPTPPADVDLDNPVCQYPFNSLNVWANGDVTPCCNFFGRKLVIGNANTNSLKEIWDGAPMAEIRRQFQTGDISATCRLCLSSRDQTNFSEATATAKKVNSAQKAEGEAVA